MNETEKVLPREEFEHVFGPITDEQWQWLKEFNIRHPVTGFKTKCPHGDPHYVESWEVSDGAEGASEASP